MDQSVVISEFLWTERPETVKERVTPGTFRSSLIVYPTETLWGLGALPFGAGIKRLQALKARTANKPFLLIWAGEDDLLRALSGAPDDVRTLVQKWAYKPITMVLRRAWFEGCEWIPECCLSPERTVAVRVDGLRPLEGLIRSSGVRAWISTSANMTGEAPAVSLDVATKLFATLPLSRILFEYNKPVLGKPSTLVDIEAKKIIRDGAVDPVW